MIPVKPPAANARSNTAGSQNRARICLRCSGGVLMIALGEYFEFTAINVIFSRDNLALRRALGQRGYPQGNARLYCGICRFLESGGSPYNDSASQTGATGFDRNLNDRRDACRATLCSSLKRVGKKQLPITMNWLSLPN